MPIHEYQCPKCKRQFEEIVSGNTVPPCPSCGERKTERLISCACFHAQANTSSGQHSYSSSGRCGGCSSGNCSTCK